MFKVFDKQFMSTHTMVRNIPLAENVSFSQELVTVMTDLYKYPPSVMALAHAMARCRCDIMAHRCSDKRSTVYGFMKRSR